MLSNMKVAELREVAEAFGVDHKESKTKAALLAQLAEEGVTEEMYAEYTGASKEEAKPVDTAPADTLVRMERANPTYEILGFKFTKDHPYVAMSQSQAQELFDSDPRGFRLATPKEVQGYYS